jgi:hypothetical protein
MAGSGTIVSAAVLSALPLDVPPLLLEMLLLVALACAFEFSELVLDDELVVVLTALAAVTPVTVEPAFVFAPCRLDCPPPCSGKSD